MESLMYKSQMVLNSKEYNSRSDFRWN